jgi:hypothetical protein
MTEELAGPLDETVLRSIQVQLEGDQQFGDVECKPSIDNLRKVSASYNTDVYPPRIVSARLDIRWTTVGDFSFHYVDECDAGNRWECRWDRHPKEIGREHFHPPTDAGKPESTDFPADYRSMMSIVLVYVSERIAEAWNE